MSTSSPHVDRLEFALEDVERAGDSGDLAVIAKLKGKADLPDGAEIVTRFGDIVAVRLKRDHVRRFADSEAIDLIEVARPLRRSNFLPSSAHLDEVAGQTRRPAGVQATGQGTVVAMLDWGVDFAYESLLTRDPDGRPRTRFLGIWDQRNGPGATANRWGYGRILDRNQIDAALVSEDPYAALAYHPGTSDARDRRTGRWAGAHGTHVIDIAAGNGAAGGPSGVAPKADLLFCHLARTIPVIGPGSLGDSANILHALDWVFETAGERPVVVNMSVGAHGGPHDGSTLIEQGIDRAVEIAPGRVVVNSAGNYYTKAAHASGRVAPDQVHRLRFHVPPNDPTPSELELWHAPSDSFVATLDGPGIVAAQKVRPGERVTLDHDGAVIARASYGPRNNGDMALRILFAPAAPGGEWTLTLALGDANDGRFHAWIERDSGLQPRFLGSSVDPSFTTGTICNGRSSITVGAVDSGPERRALGRFSSAGPTRDGRVKPEVVAPGVGVRAARSAPPGALPGPRFTTKSGTSMAAPHVAGTIALMQECLGERIEIADMRALLFSSLTRPDLTESHARDRDLHRVGHGVLDIASAERAARAWRDNRQKPEDMTMDAQMDDLAASDTLPAPTIGIVAEGEEDDLADEFLGGAEDAFDTHEMIDDNFGAPWETTPEALPEEAGTWPWDQIDEDADRVGAPEEDPLLAAVSAAVPSHVGLLTSLTGVDLLRATQAAIPLVGSREFLSALVQPGDVVRSTYGDRLAMVASEEPETAEALSLRGVPVAWSGPGSYVELLEDAGHGVLQPVARRLTDPSGRVARGVTLLRPQDTVDDLSWLPADQADPWCQRRQDIARLALAEERDWTRPDGRKRVESDPGRLPALVRYWSATPGFRAPARAQQAARRSAALRPADDDDDLPSPWSAVFINFVMRSAGVRRTDGFEFSRRHLRYIVGALRNRERSDTTRPFWLVDAIELVNEVQLAAGDLICFNRRVWRNGRRVWTNHSYDSLRRQYWLNGNQNALPEGNSHTSLVVRTERRNGRDFVQTVGGNEGDSVRLRRIPINAGGGIDNPAARHIFGAIKITRC